MLLIQQPTESYIIQTEFANFASLHLRHLKGQESTQIATQN